MTTQQILNELWRLKNAAYDLEYTQRKIIELILYYAPMDVQEAVGRVYTNENKQHIIDPAQVPPHHKDKVIDVLQDQVIHLMNHNQWLLDKQNAKDDIELADLNASLIGTGFKPVKL